ncbi:hypothetical protein SD70_07575 [Gordoniibacillus kamchatkensis]|uniref:HD-GYP domain-containing protein n=1 Tax=Gordoniibacillus kamchatkensis TaxID=1590651 RepID=A0ABR5AJU6_9BACL|nr:HD-GYP domain-containing protein [Paenibacillus sp. VKM B-2647]KIL41308.1 hypothetical protein SD70_07575 [Paenibacillus sp. VKM B-2647]
MMDLNGEANGTNGLIGFRLKRDIFNKYGSLLIAAPALLNQGHLELLESHAIQLTGEDVVTAGQEENAEQLDGAETIDQLVEQVYTIFQDVRYSKKVPLADIRKHIIPAIHQSSDELNVFGLLSSLQAKDDYTYRHNIGVAVLATLIGKWLNMKEHDLLQLSTAALLHDIGKMMIPPDILDKPDKLTNEEFELMKKHIVFGYELIKGTVGTNHRQALVALQHHERMDGRGYPFGLEQEKIDYFSRIVMIADVFHAMTSQKIYRSATPLYEILRNISQNAFGVFDAKIVSVFLNRIMQSLVGHEVVLTDGSKGKIVYINPFAPVHPLVQIEELFLDLSKHTEAQIDHVLA